MKFQVIGAVKELAKMGLSEIKFSFDKEKDMYYFDLNTQAKRGLHLYEDWHLEGRYGYTHQIEIEDWYEMKDILSDIFFEFKGCIHGRDFYNQDWMEVGVQLGLVEKKVQTHTTVTYE